MIQYDSVEICDRSWKKVIKGTLTLGISENVVPVHSG